MASEDTSLCELKSLYSLMGKKWTLRIFHNIGSRPVTYNGLGSILNRQIHPTLLSKRLKEFVRLKLVAREKANGKIQYSLTSEGAQMKQLLQLMKKFAKSANYRIPPRCQAKCCSGD